MGLDYVILEAWSQGFLVGGLVILIMITLANIRKGVLLHKLILLELLFSLGHGTFVIFPDPTYGWYLSSTASVPVRILRYSQCSLLDEDKTLRIATG